MNLQGSFQTPLARRIRAAAPYLAVALLAVLLPTPAHALSDIGLGNVLVSLVDSFGRPILKIFQVALIVGGVGMAIVKLWSAAKGGAKDWLPVGLFLLVALVAAAPATFAGMLSKDVQGCVEWALDKSKASACPAAATTTP